MTDINEVAVPVPASMRRQKDPNRGKIKPADFAVGDVLNHIHFGQGRFQPVIKGPFLVVNMVHHFIAVKALNDDGSFNPNGKDYTLTTRTLREGQAVIGTMVPKWEAVYGPQGDNSAPSVDSVTLAAVTVGGEAIREFPGL